MSATLFGSSISAAIADLAASLYAIRLLLNLAEFLAKVILGLSEHANLLLFVPREDAEFVAVLVVVGHLTGTIATRMPLRGPSRDKQHSEK